MTSTNVEFTSEVTVRAVDFGFTGGDSAVCAAARTSTAGFYADPAATAGLIDSLMRNRHGSPFEHTSATWRVRAPLFVWREHHRHRMASYNEESARFKVLDPVFYIPPVDRPLVQVGKPMAYEINPGSDDQIAGTRTVMMTASIEAYARYELLLRQGVAREVARMVLPVNIMSTCIVTMNARALMNFLSLRVDSPDSTYPSKPLYEIQKVAEAYERDFQKAAPITHAAFVANGRVAP